MANLLPLYKYWLNINLFWIDKNGARDWENWKTIPVAKILILANKKVFQMWGILQLISSENNYIVFRFASKNRNQLYCTLQ